MTEPNPYRGFILSAGRTGTVWLAETLGEQFPDVQFIHEPPPARAELMLGNLRNRWGIGGRYLRWRFVATRRKRVSQLRPQQSYVEINPMLCAITDLLSELDIPLNVVHQVRDPRTWTASILRFKASGIWRHLIDYIPLATPYPSPRPRGWRSMDMTQRTLWRWRFCNQQILNIQSACDRYALVRYEDVFCEDESRRDSAVASVLATLRLEPQGAIDSHSVERRINAAPASPAGDELPDESLVQSICGDLLTEFGYETPS